MFRKTISLIATAIIGLTLSSAPASATETAQAPSPVITGLDNLISDGWVIPVGNADSTVSYYADGSAYLAVAESLDTYSAETPGYAREDKFGSAWTTKINKCDTRNRILQRDLVEYTTDADGCKVLTGTLYDPYTGDEIDFVRDNAFGKGTGNSSLVQIDHIIPLKAAWNGGASLWTQEERIAFANDPNNLWAMYGPANASKSDSLLGQWSPPNASFTCIYSAKMTWLLDQYDIAVLDATKSALIHAAQSCSAPSVAVEPAPDVIEPTETAQPSEAPVTPEIEPTATAEATHNGELTPTVIWCFIGIVLCLIVAVTLWVSPGAHSRP